MDYPEWMLTKAKQLAIEKGYTDASFAFANSEGIFFLIYSNRGGHYGNAPYVRFKGSSMTFINTPREIAEIVLVHNKLYSNGNAE